MARKIEVGTIQGINEKQGKSGKIKVRYEVKLDSGAQLLVNENCIRPIPTKKLSNGIRLKVEHNDGSVISASRVIRPIGTKQPKPRSSPSASIPKPSPNPEPISENKKYPPNRPIYLIIKEINQAQGHILLVDDRNKIFNFNLPSGQKIWAKLRVNEVVEVTPTNIDKDGNQKFKLNLLNTLEKTIQEKETNTKPPDERTSRLRCEPLTRNEGSTKLTNRQGEAGRHEFDQYYFRERQAEKHSLRIMNFLKERINEGNIEWYQMKPAQPARFDTPGAALPPGLTQAISNAEFNNKPFKFFTHQSRALDSIRAGRNVLLVTQTASGKTLSYNPGIFETLFTDPAARALYIFPLNALLMDQKQKIDGVRRHLKHHGIQINAEILKGGISRPDRHNMALSNPHIVGTNPEMLGMMLQEATSHWRQYFAGLRYVIVDEVHFYRGLLGVHMAGLIRRLLLTARRFGHTPQFILSSATIANPQDLAQRLTTLPIESFDTYGEKSDGSGQAVKHWATFNPDAGGSEGYNGYLGAAALAMVELLCATDEQGRHKPLNTILFAKSMRDVNKVYDQVQSNLSHRRPDLVHKVRKFISATLEQQEKEEIYNGLRQGRYVGVVSTNALEAGIDIGHLDACIIAGFPFSVMRMRQMAGRVGRKNEGLVLFVPHPANPVDEYYRDHPNLLLDQPPEVFVVDAENPNIIRKHLNAAAYHLDGLSQSEAEIFGAHTFEMLDEAEQKRAMFRRNGLIKGTRRKYWDLDDEYAIHNIRSNVQRPYVVCQANSQPCQALKDCFDNSKNKCSRRVAVVDRQYIYRDCHPGAIYEDVNGNFYKVLSLDETHKTVLARPLPDDFMERTFVDEHTSIDILDSPPQGERSLPVEGEMAWGRVKVTRSFDGYYSYTLEPARRCRMCRKEFDDTTETCPFCSRTTVSFFRQSQPQRHDFPAPYRERGFQIVMKTTGAWLTIPAKNENYLLNASPCKLPGNENQVQTFLKRPFLDFDAFPQQLNLTEKEKTLLCQYYQTAGEPLHRRKQHKQKETILYPGVYEQCLLSKLRAAKLPETRALELFEAATGYPVTSETNHVCRQCQTSVLLPAMQTIQNTVIMRYPSVALGDQADLASTTTLSHKDTGRPTIFWFDSYEGGIGAAEKVYEKLGDLLMASWTTIRECSCTTINGCPRCTQTHRGSSGQSSLSKPAAVQLLFLLLQLETFDVDFGPFIYRARQEKSFNQRYAENESIKRPHQQDAAQPDAEFDPYQILRIQRRVHEVVLKGALDVRQAEITDDMPPISARQLEKAVHLVKQEPRLTKWDLSPKMSPYEILEILPSASSRMTKRVYRIIAREIHPDVNPRRRQWATEMMQLVNRAYEQVMKDMKKSSGS